MCYKDKEEFKKKVVKGEIKNPVLKWIYGILIASVRLSLGVQFSLPAIWIPSGIMTVVFIFGSIFSLGYHFG